MDLTLDKITLNQLTHRQAAPKDADAARALTRSAYGRWVPVIGREPLPMTADYEQAMIDHRFDLWHHRDTLVGLIETEAHEDHLYIVNIAVTPELQGRGLGLGERMITHAEDLAREAGFGVVRLRTNQKMDANIRLYRRLGFVVESIEPINDGFAVYMAKTLAAPRRLVFFPGAGASPDFWRPLGEALPKGWTKTYLGWPGLGEQPGDPAIRSFDDLVDLADAAIGDEPADVLAQSMGTVIAMLIALRRPGAISRLVLTVGSGGVDMEAHNAFNWRPGYRWENPDAAEWIMTAKPDLSRELHKVRQRTLLIWGDKDPISPVAVGQTLNRLIRRSHLHVVPGGDHDLAQTHAAAIAPLITTFLNQEPGQ